MGEETSTSPVFIDVAGLSIEIRIQGNGRTILFLHPELGFDGARPMIDALARHGRVLAPSHPGFGNSQLPPWLTSVDDLAYFYLDLLAALNLRDVVVVGASLGGWVAAAIAVKNTERLSALVLAGAVGIRVGERDRRDIGDLFGLTRADYEALVFHDPASAPPPAETLGEDETRIYCRNRETLALLAWAPYMHDPKLHHRLHRIDIPTLVLWGEHDRFAAPNYGRAYSAAIPGARFATLAGAGHFPHLERPGDFAGAVAEFMTQAGG